MVTFDVSAEVTRIEFSSILKNRFAQISSDRPLGQLYSKLIGRGTKIYKYELFWSHGRDGHHAFIW